MQHTNYQAHCHYNRPTVLPRTHHKIYMTIFDIAGTDELVDSAPIGRRWHPPQPPPDRHCYRTKAKFYAYILLPGLSIGFHAATIGRSRSSITAYRHAARRAAAADPEILSIRNHLISSITAEIGVQMAEARGRSQLPYWSSLAMFEYRKRGFSRRAIARLFCCSPATVANVLQGKGRAYSALTGERTPHYAQLTPPRQWGERRST